VQAAGGREGFLEGEVFGAGDVKADSREDAKKGEGGKNENGRLLEMSGSRERRLCMYIHTH
jgi:hypothetical protein